MEVPSEEFDPVRQKAALFCPQCECAIAFPGSWLRDERSGPDAVSCPECGRQVVRREHRSTGTVTAVWTSYARAVSEWWVADDCRGT